MVQKQLILGIIRFTHSNNQGLADFEGTLNTEFAPEEGQWVGVCRELGTVAYADTLDEVNEELEDAVNLQLNEMERIADVQLYLAQNEVAFKPIPAYQAAGFAVAGNLVTA